MVKTCQYERITLYEAEKVHETLLSIFGCEEFICKDAIEKIRPYNPELTVKRLAAMLNKMCHCGIVRNVGNALLNSHRVNKYQVVRPRPNKGRRDRNK